jgi:hypothetical protein
MRRRLVIPAVLALALAAGAAWAGEAWKQGYSRQAQQALNRARASAGGQGWDYLRGWHETGREGAVAYEAWYDPVRYGMRVERQAAGGKDVHGFNGLGAWRITAAGQVSGTDAAGAVAQARSEAFYGVSGFYFSGRFDAAGRYVGARRLGGRSFEVVEVKPYGGEAHELWFDRRTGLLARATARGVTTEFFDYRKVGPLKVAFRVTTEDGTPGGRRERMIEAVDFRPVDRALFSLPRELK